MTKENKEWLLTLLNERAIMHDPFSGITGKTAMERVVKEIEDDIAHKYEQLDNARVMLRDENNRLEMIAEITAEVEGL